MPQFKLEEPMIPTTLEEILPEALEDELLIRQKLIREVSYAQNNHDNLIFEKSHFIKVDFSSNSYKGFEAVDCLFEACDFSNMEWIAGAFHRVIFKNCKLTGINFAESLLQNCQFIDCSITYASFNFSQLKRVFFSESQLRFSEFNEVKWQHLELFDCDLDQSHWLNTSLNKLNWSSCHFESLAISPDLVRGLICNYEQAVTMALTLGIVLDEPLKS